ncbi:hypothetical protein AB0K09_11860 [Streptomyces sp. NPDC049577]|uniref:hypothetical protein n=1 Tax=Streptomyces sp. NPDC049577 TaxID=3155153 RepID=UPI0034258F9B
MTTSRVRDRSITCELDEVAVGDVRPGDLADVVLEGDQVSSDETCLGKRASRSLIVMVGLPDFVGPRGKAVLALELACHRYQDC